MLLPSLFLYNRLTRKKEAFVPLAPDCVKMYVCGPTVYGPIHMGNARSVVVFDMVFRVLKYFFPHVLYVRNITDVEDKINAEAKKQSISIAELTEGTTQQFHKDIQCLNVLPVAVEPRATHHIQEMIALIEKLIARNMAYVADRHVLFDVAQDESYGTLSGAHKDEILAGARVEVAPYKRNPQDFVLWKPAEEDFWPSPWGNGRPGWHIECSAMSLKYLGEVFDIHGGGADLCFPHHENERAQSRGALNVEEHVRYWVHNGMLVVGGQKMSKSVGNFLVLRDVLAYTPGPVVRWALLSSHYRHELDWAPSLLHQAAQCVETVWRVLDLPCECKVPVDPEILAYMCDDFNTPAALNALYLAAKRGLYDATWVPIVHASAEFMGIQRPSYISECIRERINALVEARNCFRIEKDFQRADQIRKELEKMGVIVEDTSEGTRWTKRF